MTWSTSLSKCESVLDEGISLPTVFPVLQLHDNREALKASGYWHDSTEGKCKAEELVRCTRPEVMLKNVKNSDDCGARQLATVKLFAGARKNMNFVANAFGSCFEPTILSVYPDGQAPIGGVNVQTLSDAFYSKFMSIDLNNSGTLFELGLFNCIFVSIYLGY